MGWANRAIGILAQGEEAVIKPHGGSMRPRVESGATVTVEPVALDDLVVGDIVLCRVKGNVYLHLVKAIRGHGPQRSVQIGNNRGKINGWTRTVYGRAIRIENP
ncbi:MAG: S24/S26 family peptidase [Myxococcota bacterium]